MDHEIMVHDKNDEIIFNKTKAYLFSFFKNSVKSKNEKPL